MKDSETTREDQYEENVDPDRSQSGTRIGSISDISGGQVNIAGHDVYNIRSDASELQAISQAFAILKKEVETMPDNPAKTMAQTAVAGLEVEAQKGEQAKEENVQQWFSFLAQMAPDIFDVAVATFNNPIVGLGMVFKKVAERARKEQEQKK